MGLDMARKQDLPNIILFISDEQRGDTISLGKRHNPVIKTENIDNLVKEGTAFTNCFTVNPVCAPSRCCIFTGVYPHSNGHRSLYQLLQPHEDNLFRFLKKNGYEVVWVGRNDLFNKNAIMGSFTKRLSTMKKSSKYKLKLKLKPFSTGNPMKKSFYFGRRSSEQGHDFDSIIIEKALEYLDSQPNKPFCLYIALAFPHPPYTVEEPYFSMYDRNQVPSPFPPKLDDKPEFMKLMHERYGLNKLNEKDFREILATYYGMVTRVDDQFGQIMVKLKDIGAYNDSAIFFFSDHGDYAGNYGLTEKWSNAFQDCLINIPLICKIPKINPKKEIYDHLVESIDIFPTILEIAQIKTPYTHFGKSLIPLLKGETDIHRDAVFAEGGYNPREPQCFERQVGSPELPLIGIYYDKTNIPLENPSTVTRSAMIRTKEWKLIIRNGAKEELYNLKADPHELHNLIDDNNYITIKSDLNEKLLRWYLNTSDNPHWKKKRFL